MICLISVVSRLVKYWILPGCSTQCSYLGPRTCGCFSWNFIAMVTAWHYSCHTPLAPFARSCGEQNKINKYHWLWQVWIIQYNYTTYESEYVILLLVYSGFASIIASVDSPPPFSPWENLPGRLSLGIASRLSPKKATVRLSPGSFGDDLMTMMDMMVGRFKEWQKMENKRQPMVHLTLPEEERNTNYCTFGGANQAWFVTGKT